MAKKEYQNVRLHYNIYRKSHRSGGSGSGGDLDPGYCPCAVADLPGIDPPRPIFDSTQEESLVTNIANFCIPYSSLLAVILIKQLQVVPFHVLERPE